VPTRVVAEPAFEEAKMDLKERIHDVLKEYPMAALATVTQDGRPWVRYIMIDADRDLHIRFTTSLHSRKVAHIQRNPEVHLTCGAALLDSMAPYLQIQAKATMTREEGLRKRMWTDTLKKYFSGPDDPDYCVGIIEPYRIEYYNMTITPEVWKPAKK
jgi:general stress protein 26